MGKLQDSQSKPSPWAFWGKILLAFLVAVAGGAIAAAVKPREDDTPDRSPTQNPVDPRSPVAHVVYDRQRGESQSAYNERASNLHHLDWEQARREEGKWEAKADYEARTGRRGRRD